MNKHTAFESYDGLKPLAGETIKEVLLSGDGEYMAFVTEDDTFVFHMDGDCCSRSWVEHTSGLHELIGKEVLRIGSVDMSEFDKRASEDEWDDFIRHYKEFLKTRAGQFDIEYRNSSNGYYGGEIYFCPGRSVEGLDLVPMTKDKD